MYKARPQNKETGYKALRTMLSYEMLTELIIKHLNINKLKRRAIRRQKTGKMNNDDEESEIRTYIN